MFFDGWADLWRVAVIGTLAHVALVVFLRVSGKRTLSKLNAIADLSEVEAVVLETDGTLSAVKGEGAVLRNVRT